MHAITVDEKSGHAFEGAQVWRKERKERNSVNKTQSQTIMKMCRGGKNDSPFSIME